MCAKITKSRRVDSEITICAVCGSNRVIPELKNILRWDKNSHPRFICQDCGEIGRDLTAKEKDELSKDWKKAYIMLKMMAYLFIIIPILVLFVLAIIGYNLLSVLPVLIPMFILGNIIMYLAYTLKRK